MSAPSASSGSQAAAASQSVGSHPQTRPHPAANSATPPSDSATLATDSATDGNTDVIEIEEDASAGKKRKLRSEVWKDYDLVKMGVGKQNANGVKNI